MEVLRSTSRLNCLTLPPGIEPWASLTIGKGHAHCECVHCGTHTYPHCIPEPHLMKEPQTPTYQLPDPVQCRLNGLGPYRVVTSGIVVGRILLPAEELIRMEEQAELASSDSICERKLVRSLWAPHRGVTAWAWRPSHPVLVQA